MNFTCDNEFPIIARFHTLVYLTAQLLTLAFLHTLMIWASSARPTPRQLLAINANIAAFAVGYSEGADEKTQVRSDTM